MEKTEILLCEINNNYCLTNHCTNAASLTILSSKSQQKISCLVKKKK